MLVEVLSRGVTVADLRQKGAMALNDAQLNELLVGKSVWMRNTVTGGQYESVYEKNGHRLIMHVGRNAIPETEVGNCLPHIQSRMVRLSAQLETRLSI